MNTKLLGDAGKNNKRKDGDQNGDRHRKPEPIVLDYMRKYQKHGEGRDYIPKGIPGMIGNFFSTLLFKIQPK